MDITTLATKKNSNDGKWFQAVLYGKKQPFEINILGDDSDEVQAYMKEQMKKINASQGLGGSAKMDEETLEELLENGDENVVIRMNGLRSIPKEEPLMLDGKELGNDEKSYRFLIEKIPEVKDFVLKTSRGRSNFLDVKKKA